MWKGAHVVVTSFGQSKLTIPEVIEAHKKKIPVNPSRAPKMLAEADAP